MGKLRKRRRWALCNGKGGTGKSTMVECLAHAAMRDGNRVLVVDADTQGTCSSAALRMRQSDQRVSHVPEDLPSSGPALLVLGALDASLVLAWEDRAGVAHNKHLEEVIGSFSPDLVLLDPPGHLDVANRAAMHRAIVLASEVAVLVTAQGQPDRDALLASVDLLREVQGERLDLHLWALLNKFRAGTHSALEAEAAVREAGLPILRSRVGNRTAFEEAFSERLRGRAPTGAAARDVAALFQELREIA